ncbi:transcriptional regulator containing PAS [Clostridium sp. SY8519]|uniref:sigma-54 interaction domain-containing protein n=1 Tax=Clostridium sp. (strain SY8519) TaxID=1042156 RepID=UPI0002171B4F|nr:sigma 54-interacting transcriptional regulator [Clostridium sp. SY8519]BAK47024.1 transcriptional regulator containing PAS [Clostridium sp. SY8519]
MRRLSLKECMEFIEALHSFALLDENARYVYVSENWCRMTHHTKENALGKKVEEIVPDTLAHQAYLSKRPVIGHLVRIAGQNYFTNYYPRLSPAGEVIGCFLFTIIHNTQEAQVVSAQLKQVEEQLKYYKNALSRERGAKYSIDNIIGDSPVMLHLKEEIIQAAQSSSTVLIEGETGTGKELIAHSVHTLSPRCDQNFVRVNCSAIPEDLMESEFFGYSDGAFTGALKGGKKGRFLVANHGSIFLDEVNLLPMTMQPKFLRALQEHEVTPVGSSESLPFDVRIISATNTPLESLVQNGKFRMDLYFRLNVIKITAPPLRAHKEDIPLLINNLIDQLNLELGTFIRGIEPDALDLLSSYNWPGNIRELRNSVEVAINRADGLLLSRKDFSHVGKLKNLTLPSKTFEGSYNLRDLRNDFERNLIQEVLKITGGNKKRAAQLLGISRTVLYDKLNLLGISIYR